MGILTYFWVIEHVHVYRDLFNIILGVMRPHLQMDYYVWQKIFIDHRNDNRANRTSLKSLRGSRCSRMRTSTTTCVCVFVSLCIHVCVYVCAGMSKTRR